MVSTMVYKTQVSYVNSVEAVKLTAPNASRLGTSFVTLFRWRRSIYQMVWRHMLFYVAAYISLGVLYKFILHDEGKRHFKDVAQYCSRHTNSINLIIMLAFFTNTALQRLFAMQVAMPGTAKNITMFVMSLKPNLPEGPMLIEKFARWQVLSWILAFRSVCKPVRKMFPDLLSLEQAGLLEEKERFVLEQEEDSERNTPRSLIVIDWILALLHDCMVKGRYFYNSDYMKNVEFSMNFKKSCGNIIKFSTQNIPHALIQAVILGVYVFGLITIVARKFTERDGKTDFESIWDYFPILPGIQFFIYVAWLNFGRAAVNPFGNDDNDINVKDLLIKHIKDSLRLQKIYTVPLDDVFPVAPEKDKFEDFPEAHYVTIM